MSCTRESSGDAHSNIGCPSGLKYRLPFLGDEVVFVRSINDDVSSREIRTERLYHAISRASMRKTEEEDFRRTQLLTERVVDFACMDSGC